MVVRGAMESIGGQPPLEAGPGSRAQRSRASGAPSPSVSGESTAAVRGAKLKVLNAAHAGFAESGWPAQNRPVESQK